MAYCPKINLDEMWLPGERTDMRNARPRIFTTPLASEARSNEFKRLAHRKCCCIAGIEIQSVQLDLQDCKCLFPRSRQVESHRLRIGISDLFDELTS